MKKNTTSMNTFMNVVNTTISVKEELSLVAAAQAGDTNARNKLFVDYMDEIRKAHIFSAAGTNPTKFGKGRNAYGSTFEEDSGRLFEVFVKALEKFDVSKVNMDSFKSTNPFLSFLKYEICHRALDKIREDETHRNRYTSMSELSKKCNKKKDKSFDDFRSDEELAAIAQEKALERGLANEGDRSFAYDVTADDIRNTQIAGMVDKVISLFPRESMEYATLTNFLTALGYAKNVIPEVARRMKVTKPTVYKYMKLALEKLPTQLAAEFRDALAA